MLERATLSSVMAGPAEGLVPAIHVFTALQLNKGVDGRDKPGHDAVVRGPE